jgi:WD repeat-containing protein 23
LLDQALGPAQGSCLASLLTESQTLQMSPSDAQPPISGDFDYRYSSAQTRHVSKAPHASDTSLMTYVGHSVARTLIRARFSPLHSTGQRYIVSGSASGSVFIYDVLSGKVHHELEHHEDICRDVSWHPFDSNIISSSVGLLV